MRFRRSEMHTEDRGDRDQADECEGEVLPHHHECERGDRRQIPCACENNAVEDITKRARAHADAHDQVVRQEAIEKLGALHKNVADHPFLCLGDQVVCDARGKHRLPMGREALHQERKKDQQENGNKHRPFLRQEKAVDDVPDKPSRRGCSHRCHAYQEKDQPILVFISRKYSLKIERRRGSRHRQKSARTIFSRVAGESWITRPLLSSAPAIHRVRRRGKAGGEYLLQKRLNRHRQHGGYREQCSRRPHPIDPEPYQDQ